MAEVRCRVGCPSGPNRPFNCKLILTVPSKQVLQLLGVVRIDHHLRLGGSHDSHLAERTASARPGSVVPLRGTCSPVEQLAVTIRVRRVFRLEPVRESLVTGLVATTHIQLMSMSHFGRGRLRIGHKSANVHRIVLRALRTSHGKRPGDYVVLSSLPFNGRLSQIEQVFARQNGV